MSALAEVSVLCSWRLGSHEFHQLLREIPIEFFRSAGDCQWGGGCVVFGFGRLLGQDSGPDDIALDLSLCGYGQVAVMERIAQRAVCSNGT